MKERLELGNEACMEPNEVGQVVLAESGVTDLDEQQSWYNGLAAAVGQAHENQLQQPGPITPAPTRKERHSAAYWKPKAVKKRMGQLEADRLTALVDCGLSKQAK